MELRALAEEILFATTLEAKLCCPEEITDEQPGTPLAAPLLPGRPKSLHFKDSQGQSSEFSGLTFLRSTEDRGRLLHYFANHELLATELMALVLLRFPDAPKSFRRGVLQTLRDEQAHTRGYLKLMQARGVEFGEIPVSGYFWRAVSGMQNPIEYVASLSLTFEQANLDFCKHFAQRFQDVGDTAASRFLDQIHRDEIAHVAYGLKWFRRWKNPDESDWQAFCRQLKFPLSPSRAKGLTLNLAARKQAGLNDEFISHLNVFTQSKGRTPHLYWFNPFAEGHIAEGPAFNPTRHQTELRADLDHLPQFLARQDDIVVVRKRPSVIFLSSLKHAGFALPEFLEQPEGPLDPEGSLAGRKLGSLRPWGWGPDSVEKFKLLFSLVKGEPSNSTDRFNPRIALLYSKAWSATFLTNFLAANPSHPWLCPSNIAGIAVTRYEDAIASINKFRNSGFHRLVAKKCLGIAGQSALRLWEPQLLNSQLRWIQKSCERGETLVIEPWLDRVLDFSIQLELERGKLSVCGYTGLMVDSRGQFQGNWAESDFRTRPPRGIDQVLKLQGREKSALTELWQSLFAALESQLTATGYSGPIGIDAFVYRNQDGHCVLKPVVEINPRYTMGRVLVELMRYAGPGCRGEFRLLNESMRRAAGYETWVAWGDALKQQEPIRMRGEPKAKVESGAILLNDPASVTRSLALFRISAKP